jgi:lysozyme
MQISEKGLALIKRFEGCSLTAYPDPATGGAPYTIGYGWTGKVDGKPIVPGMTIKQETAERLLRCGIVIYEQDISRLVRVRLNQNQFDALVSLSWNIGTRAFSTSTLLQKLNSGDYQGAADQFLRWVNANGREMPGLVTRRRAERDLFLS